MNEHDLATLLRATAAGITVPAAPTEQILAAGRRRVRRRRAVEVLGTVAVVAAVLVPVGLGPRATTSTAEPGGCAAVVQPRVLPDWARAGFTPPDQPTPYVLGERGEIAAIPFGPLTSPPAAGRNNKILWVARTTGGPGPLTITAHRSGDPHLTLLVQDLPDGPGPSSVDVPAPGCWTFDLRWASGSDTLDLRYEPG
jgi:hypothetical protein